MDALLRFSRYPVPHALLVDVAETMDRYGRLQLVNDPAHGLVLRASTGRYWSRWRSPRSSPACSARTIDAGHRGGAPVRARPAQAGAAQAGLAGRGPGRVRRRRGAPDHSARGRLGAALVPAGGGGALLGRRLRRGRAALRRRQDPGRGGGDGAGLGHHPDPGDQHGGRAAVEARADRPHLAHRGRDRRVLRRAQGDPAGHHRHVPGAHHPARRRLRPPGPVRRPGLGPGHLRRGAPAARADLPVHRRPAGPPPARADRHAGPRGRPGGRRLLADRPQAVRRAVEGHRGAGLDRAGRAAPRCGSP